MIAVSAAQHRRTVGQPCFRSGYDPQGQNTQKLRSFAGFLVACDSLERIQNKLITFVA